MKPRFALNLSHEGIGLLHRAKRGWNLVGEVSLEDPDLPRALHMLRETASALETAGVRSKLIIPNSQILYTTVPAPTEAGIETAAYIRQRLEGLTPYDVGDLVFDWAAEGNQIRLAVVARETLDEAESFAGEHRFNPVSFVARPQDGQFPSEPFFGPTRQAATLLNDGETLEPDDQAIAIHGRDHLPETAPDAAPKADADATTDPAPNPAAQTSDTAPPEAMPCAPAPQAPKPPQTTPDPAPTDIPAELAALPLPTEPDGAAAAGMLEALASKSERLQAFETGDTTKLPEGTAPAVLRPVTAPRTPQAAPAIPAPTPEAGAALRAGPLASAAAIGTPGLVAWIAAMIVLLVAAALLWALLGLGRDTTDAPEDITQIQTAALAPQRPGTPALPDDPVGHQAPSDLQPTPGNGSTQSAAPAAPLLAALPGAPALPAQIALPQAAFPAPDLAAAPTAPTGPAPASETNTGTNTDTDTGRSDPTTQTGTELAALDLGRITGDLTAQPVPPETERAFTPPLPEPVTPTPEGALSYRGVMVFAGRPPAEVAPRPKTALTDTAQGGSITADANTPPPAPAEATQESPDPQLAQYRPRARPRTAAVEDAAAVDTPAAAAPDTATAPTPEAPPSSNRPNQNLGGINWAGLRPQSRPQADAQTEQTAQTSDTAPASRVAMARSPLPQARPKNFAQSVQSALQQVQPAPAEPPQAQAVPATAALAPSTPTVTSVARQATEANAIRLNRLNLIGVYGATSDRRALVRLASGRYVKLKIGDRLDGGKVAAITERELHYIKSGRNIVLSMPKG